MLTADILVEFLESDRKGFVEVCDNEGKYQEQDFFLVKTIEGGQRVVFFQNDCLSEPIEGEQLHKLLSETLDGDDLFVCMHDGQKVVDNG